MLKAEFAGESAPDSVAEKTQIDFRLGRYSVRFAGQEADAGTYELGTTDSLQTIVMRGATGTNAGRTLPGIYQLVGNRLRLCVAFDDVMPSGFSKPSAHQFVALYRRDATTA